MNKGLHYLFVACLFAFLGCISLAELKAQTTPPLKHSYTFEDGTAADVIGGANGTVNGGVFNNGVYVANGNDHFITLPAAEIAINTFPAVTLEGFISTSGANGTSHTMLAYFGDSKNNFGSNGFFIQPTTGSSTSKAAISTGNESKPWDAETRAESKTHVDSEGKHHVVAIITSESISYYVDGVHQATTKFADDTHGNSLSKVSNNFAWIGKGGYSNDPAWKGSIYEFNIYEGALDASTIATRAEAFISDTEPTLSAITVTVGGETYSLSPAFSPNVTEYTVKVPNGTTTATVSATPTYESSTVSGGGEKTLVDGTVTTEILVTTTQNETKTYTVIIEELSIDANLKDITVKVGEEVIILDPVFDPNSENSNYNVSVPFGTPSFNISVTPNHPAALAEGAGNIDIVDGKGIATIVVTAEDGETTRTYTIQGMESGLEANADLQTLKFGQGELMPPFDPEVTEYSLVVYDRRGFVNVFAKTAVSDATLEGEAAELNVVPLNEDGTGSATFVITAMDGTTKKTYTVNIRSEFPTAIGGDINSPLKVYPTFSKGEFTVEFGSAAGKVTVYDLSGKIILEKATNTSKTTVNVQEAGMYIFHLETKGLNSKIKAFKVN